MPGKKPRTKHYKPRPVYLIPPLFLRDGVSDDRAAAIERRARDIEIKILLSKADASEADYLAEVIFVGYRLAGEFNEADEIRSAMHAGMASLFSLEYRAEYGLPLPEDDVRDLGHALDTALSAVRAASCREVIAAQALWDSRKTEYLTGFRTYTRSVFGCAESEQETQQETTHSVRGGAC